MRYIVEQWNALLEWLGTGKKVMLGIIFFIAGVIVNWLWRPPEGLMHGSFLLLMTGVLFFVNALFSKLCKCNIHVVYFILAFIVILELALYLSGDLQKFSNAFMLWGPCFLFVWALQYVVLQVSGMEKFSKRAVIAFLETAVGTIGTVAVFVIPIWLKSGGSL